MSLKVRFAISLVVIMLIGWADVFFVGTSRHAFFPHAFHQPLHIVALLLTMLIGYLHWKEYPEKWLFGLWFTAYLVVLTIIAIAGLVYLLKATSGHVILNPIVYLRNLFTWPLPFLVCYMLHLMATRLLPGKK